MKKWEYVKQYDPSEDFMDQMGEKGWELVAAYSPGEGYNPVFVFKREKQ